MAEHNCSGVLKKHEGGCGGKNPAVVRVKLTNGADVYWCGPCIVRFAETHRDELEQGAL
jgi:hypothetical protein